MKLWRSAKLITICDTCYERIVGRATGGSMSDQHFCNKACVDAFKEPVDRRAEA